MSIRTDLEIVKDFVTKFDDRSDLNKYFEEVQPVLTAIHRLEEAEARTSRLLSKMPHLVDATEYAVKMFVSISNPAENAPPSSMIASTAIVGLLNIVKKAENQDH